MNFVLLAVLLISIWDIRFRKGDNSDYLNPKQTAAVNGIFVMFVFMRHCTQYMEMERFDNIFGIVNTQLGQMIVTTFLFYSGYGIMYSLKSKNNYVSYLPKRFLMLLLHFDLAVLIYLLVNTILGNNYSLSTILLSLIGWSAIGNSSWYILAVLCLYIITYISAVICKTNHLLLIILATIGCGAYLILLFLAGKTWHYFDTIFCFPIGMLYCHYKDAINSFLLKKKSTQVTCIVSSFIAFLLLFIIARKLNNPIPHLISISVRNISFAIFLVLFTSLVKIRDKILDWLGKYIFEIYIMQRLSMMLFKDIISNKYLFFFTCATITLLFAIIYKKVLLLIDSLFFKKKVA